MRETMGLDQLRVMVMKSVSFEAAREWMSQSENNLASYRKSDLFLRVKNCKYQAANKPGDPWEDYPVPGEWMRDGERWNIYVPRDQDSISKLTCEEETVNYYLVAAWNSFAALPGVSADEINEFRCSINYCQQAVGFQVAKRTNPHAFNS